MPKDALCTTQLEKLLEHALKSLPTGLFICDRGGIVRFINDAYSQYLQIAPQDVVGHHITKFIPDSRIPAVLESGVAEMGARRQIRSGGKSTTLLVNRLPLRDADGEIMGVLSMTLLDAPEQISKLLHQVEALDKQVNAYTRRMKSALTSRYTLDSILGSSAPMRMFREHLRRYAETDSPVLILGATGTGKELAAGAIHSESPRADGPFVDINCAAIPRELFESEIFGYVPGAFSGAHKDGKVGRIELAHQGTLFLDEIGDLPMEAQVKLLRVLEEKKLHRLGSSQDRVVDFRLVAATNRDLAAMIRAGTFREDLYYRINPLTLRLPSLRERAEDIPQLTRAIMDRLNAEAVACGESAMAALLRYSWPGNIRELRNVIVRALSLCSGGVITLADLPPDVLHGGVPAEKSATHTASPTTQLHAVVSSSESQAILAALEEHGWNVSRAAKSLGISRATIYEKMKRFGIARGPHGHGSHG